MNIDCVIVRCSCTHDDHGQIVCFLRNVAHLRFLDIGIVKFYIRKFMLKLTVHHSGKLAPKENSLPYSNQLSTVPYSLHRCIPSGKRLKCYRRSRLMLTKQKIVNTTRSLENSISIRNRTYK